MVNAYFDDLRCDGGRPYSVPQAVGPPYLAGAFSPVLCDVRLYNEQYSGPLEDKDLLGWPDSNAMSCAGATARAATAFSLPCWPVSTPLLSYLKARLEEE